MAGKVATEICENPKPGREPSNLRMLGFYLLNPDFFSYYEKINKHHPEDLIDGLNLLLKEEPVEPIVLDKELQTLKYPWDLFGLMDLMFNSESFQPRISPSAEIRKNVVINGQVHIGDGAIIKKNTVINGPCYIGEGCEIGPGNVLRGPVNLEKEVKTGAFCEIKNSIVQEGTHFHSGYVGDSLIGQNCRFGAGFISANRRLDRKNIGALVKGTMMDTGLTHFGLVAGADVKFGIHCGTMPGVFIGSGSGIWPGSIVFKNQKDASLFRQDS
jgi:bifunctional UDP-N-acetylglucosamine pyrophosphorylase/glucosamine-1-phosphate N-acetyltransferase